MRIAIQSSPSAAPRPADCTWPSDSAVTVGAVARAAGLIPHRPDMISVDGHLVPTAAPTSVAPLCRGAVLGPAAVTAAIPDQAAPVLVVDGGLAAGARHRVATPVAVGRAPGNDVVVPDPTVSRRHARITVGPADVRIEAAPRTVNPVLVDGAPVPVDGVTVVPVERRGEAATIVGPSLSLGASRLLPLPPDPARPAGPAAPSSGPPPDPDGRRPWPRPPRAAPPPRPGPVPLPALGPVPPAAPFAWVTVLVPLVGGLAAAVLVAPAMAALTLLGPVYAVAAWFEQRRRRHRALRRRADAERTAVQATIAALAAAHGATRAARRAAAPGPGVVVHRIHTDAPELWERRPHHPDFLALRVGLSDEPFAGPDLDGPGADEMSAAGRFDIEQALVRLGPLVDVPLVVDAREGPVGIVGPLDAVRAAARAAVIQVAAHHGPADVIVTATDATVSDPAWAWLDWLPHWVPPAVAVAPGPGAPRVFTVDDRTDAARTDHAAGAPPPTGGVVVALHRRHLPATCTAIVELTDGLGRGRVVPVGEAGPGHPMLADGLPLTVAASAARRLARWRDPEAAPRPAPGGRAATLPTLLPLPATPDALARHLRAAWAEPGDGRSLAAVIGEGPDGPCPLDLVADGPHALVAGTTGAGKSELLRTLVVALALGHRPDDVTFLLVDFKGGAAFDACADLPHVAGVLTDLDDHLVRRALAALEAELHHREHLLRRHGADDLVAYRRGAPADTDRPPLPRLVVVVDEFAALGRAQPDALAALVSIGQRGRSLGLHLVLATQRPAGVITDQLRTNTNLRIALRLIDAADAHDVVGADVPTRLPRHEPGHAVIRRDDGDLVSVRTALATSPWSPHRPGVTVRFEDGPDPTSPPDDAGRPRFLDQAVAATIAAAADLGIAPARPIWHPPLPTVLPDEPEPGAMAPGSGPLVLGLTDDPSRRLQLPWTWAPERGPLLVAGAPGTGATSLLRTVAAQALRRDEPGTVHVYAVVPTTGALAELAAHAAVGAVVTHHDGERVARLVDRLAAEARRRGDGSVPAPRLFLLVDGIEGLLDTFEGLDGMRRLERLTALWRDGHRGGIHVAATAHRMRAVPVALAATAATRAVLGPPEPGDLPVGVARPAPIAPGRGWTAEGHEVQVRRVTAGAIEALAATWPARPPFPPPAPIGTLPATVAPADLPAVTAGPRLEIPVGVRHDDLGPAVLTLHPGEPALVAGPARSGVSTLLAAIAGGLTEAGVPVHTVTAACASIDGDGLAALVASARDHRSGVVLIVDDADLVGADGGALATALEALLRQESHHDPGRGGAVHVIAGGRTDRLRRAYGHWARAAGTTAGAGIALAPDPDLDADLWGTTFPRPAVRGPAGRGYLVVDRTPVLMQAVAVGAGP